MPPVYVKIRRHFNIVIIKIKNSPQVISRTVFRNGAIDEIRTHDLHLTMVLLYLLSYNGIYSVIIIDNL